MSQINSILFIATAAFDHVNVKWTGEGNTPESAFNDLIESGEFNDYCACNDVKDNQSVEVGIFNIIHKSDPEWDEDIFDDGWEWVLNDRVDTKFVTYQE